MQGWGYGSWKMIMSPGSMLNGLGDYESGTEAQTKIFVWEAETIREKNGQLCDTLE